MFPSVTADGLELHFASDRSGGAGGSDLYVARRDDVGDDFANVENLAEINTPYWESSLSVSADGLTLFLGDMWDSSPDGFGSGDVWMATRSGRLDRSGDWIPSARQNLGPPISSSQPEGRPYITPDWPATGAKLLFCRRVQVGDDWKGRILEATWMSEETPETSFLRGDSNNDGRVDISDAAHVLNRLFLGGAEPQCVAAANTNGDEAADISDASFLLGHLFLGGVAPSAPFPECGVPGLATLTADEKLGCVASSCP